MARVENEATGITTKAGMVEMDILTIRKVSSLPTVNRNTVKGSRLGASIVVPHGW